MINNLSLNIINFNFKNKNTEEDINLTINYSGIYNIYTSRKLAKELILSCSGIKSNYKGEILINNTNIKINQNAKHFLQRYSLFVNEKCEFIDYFKTQENLSYISRFWSNQDLSTQAIIACNIEKFHNNLNLINFAKTILCQSYLWFIPNKIFDHLTSEELRYVHNIQDAKIKQGGAIIIINY